MWEQIQSNRRKSIFLVIATAFLLAALGYALGEYFGGRGYGVYGVGFAMILWVIMTAVSMSQGDQVLLAVAGAKKIEKKDLPQLFNVVEEMTLASGLPKMPDVYVIDDPSPNAFAAGRSPEKAAVAVTRGLLKSLNRDELQGVIAHEMAHVKNRDVQLMTYAGVLVGAIVILAEVGFRGMLFGGGRSRSRRRCGFDVQGIIAVVAIVLMILAPILARLIYFAISRKREYLADASSASFTRYPEGLASALEKIAHSSHKLRSANSATAPMYIINPLKRTKKMAANATSTHPPIDERVKILRSMGGGGYGAYDEAFRSVTGKGGVMPGSALKEDAGGDLRGPEAGGPVDTTAGVLNPLERERARQVDDLFYKQDGWERIACPCGTVLKLPPDFDAKVARCPHCGRGHKVS